MGIDYNKFMNKYKEEYIVQKQEDNIIAIKCKGKGTIDLYSALSPELGFYIDKGSKRKLNMFLKKLPLYINIITQGETEVYLSFPEDKLKDMVPYLKPYMKRHLSLETKEKLRLNIEKARMGLNSNIINKTS